MRRRNSLLRASATGVLTLALMMATISAQVRAENQDSAEASVHSMIPVPAGRVLRQSVPWSDIQLKLKGKRVYIGRADASVAYGKVKEVTDEGIITSHSGQSEQISRRADIKFIQYDQHRGKSRALWATGLGVAGLALTTLLVAKETFGDGSAPGAIPVAIGAGTGGAVGGYVIGRGRDRQTVVLTVQD